MSGTDLAMLERDVEEARRRVKADLTALRAPENMAELKRRAISAAQETKAQIVAKAQNAARDRATGVLEAVGARIAANPGAALAIAGALAWRLVRHPPVASALIGVGVMGLLRTDPKEPALGSDLAARAANFADSARREIEEWRAGSGVAKVSDLAATAKERMGEWAEETSRVVHHANVQVGRGASRLVSSGRQIAARSVNDTDRDTVLLGAAALAIAAAMGISYRRGEQRIAQA